MKLIICGKGGSGKSTLTAMLAHEYARKNFRVLVVDTDESNIGLHRLIGIDAPVDLMEYFGGRPGMKEKIMAAAPDYAKVKLIEEPWKFDSIPADYVSRKDNIALVSIGKIQHSGEGCACPMGMLSRQFLQSLQLAENDIVITDTEAGIEHFGRGIDEEADGILMVLDPSFESVGLAEKITTITDGMGISLYFILNRVNSEMSATIRKKLSKPANIIAEIPDDPEILSTALSGDAITRQYAPIEALVKEIPYN